MLFVLAPLVLAEGRHFNLGQTLHLNVSCALLDHLPLDKVDLASLVKPVLMHHWQDHLTVRYVKQVQLLPKLVQQVVKRVKDVYAALRLTLELQLALFVYLERMQIRLIHQSAFQQAKIVLLKRARP